MHMLHIWHIIVFLHVHVQDISRQNAQQFSKLLHIEISKYYNDIFSNCTYHRTCFL